MKYGKGNAAPKTGCCRGAGTKNKQGCRNHSGPSRFNSEKSLYATFANFLPETAQKTAPGNFYIQDNKIPISNTQISEEEADTGTNKIQKPEISPEFQKKIAFINLDECTGCGICQDVCETGALVVDNAARINPDKCKGCGACIPVCPNEAIILT